MKSDESTGLEFAKIRYELSKANLIIAIRALVNLMAFIWIGYVVGGYSTLVIPALFLAGYAFEYFTIRDCPID